MYYEKLKELFGGQRPAVRSFNQIMQSLSSDEQQEAIRLVYRVALAEWGDCNAAYRLFLIRFLEEDLQRFLDHLRRESCWGELLIPLEDAEWLMLLFFALAEPKKTRKLTRRVLAFSLLLFTGHKDWKISTLLQYRKTRPVTTAELAELMRWVKVGG